jgi:hypothetical protein
MGEDTLGGAFGAPALNDRREEIRPDRFAGRKERPRRPLALRASHYWQNRGKRTLTLCAAFERYSRC